MRVQRDYSMNHSKLVTNTYEKKVQKNFSEKLMADSVTISETARKLAKAAHEEDVVCEEGVVCEEDAVCEEDVVCEEEVDFCEMEKSSEGESCSRSVAINAGKLARMIAAAKTKEQIQMVLAKIKSDIQEVKAALKQGASTESELNKANSLLAAAQNRMGQVEDRAATPEEEKTFLMSTLM